MMPYTEKEKAEAIREMDEKIAEMKDIRDEDKRWETSVRHQPERFQVARRKDGVLKVIYDTDTGHLHMRLTNNGKEIWVEFP